MNDEFRFGTCSGVVGTARCAVRLVSCSDVVGTARCAVRLVSSFGFRFSSAGRPVSVKHTTFSFRDFVLTKAKTKIKPLPQALSLLRNHFVFFSRTPLRSQFDNRDCSQDGYFMESERGAGQNPSDWRFFRELRFKNM